MGQVPRVLFSALAIVVALAFPAGALAADPPAPYAISQGWQYAPDGADAGLGANWQSGAAGTAWTPATIPHVFEAQPLERYFAGSIGWYRVGFTGPPTATNAGWWVRFNQVRRLAKVWLNGKEIGTHRDPYTPFELPAKGLLPGKPNVLVIRADNRRPRGTREGWWNWGGITRSVSLVARGQVVLHDAGVLPRKRCEGKQCHWETIVDGWLENRSSRSQRPAVRLALRSPDGESSYGGTRARTLRPGERVRVRFTVKVRGKAKLWAPEDPQLYAATVRTVLGGRTIQADQRRIGLRTVKVVDGALRLNGRTLDLRGASIQEDMPGRGPALTDADIETIVGELKSLGANVTRAHYLLDERLLRRFDEEGILVWSQAPVYHRDAMLKTPRQRSFELDNLRNTILAARNHPSVITHSVANELTPRPDDVKTTRIWMLNAAELARDLDSTLPVSIDVLSYPRIPRQKTYDAFDLLGINSYYGWYAGKPERSTANLDDLAPYLRAMHAKYPAHSLVMTEFGAEATEEGPADVKQTYAFQSRYLKRNLDIIDRLGFMGGAIYWTAREFAVKPYWDGGAKPLPVNGRDSIHNKALIAYDGTPKPAFAVARDAFRATPLYRNDPAAVARAQLSEETSIVARSLLVIAALGLLGALLALDAVCLRDIWRCRPREAQVVELQRRRAA
ncbi:MAG: beta-galactosidase [Solirubrobacteraceae bacterium]|nr:beta-galactosidase [Solirubrobacteraceae bacterium]